MRAYVFFFFFFLRSTTKSNWKKTSTKKRGRHTTSNERRGGSIVAQVAIKSNMIGLSSLRYMCGAANGQARRAASTNRTSAREDRERDKNEQGEEGKRVSLPCNLTDERRRLPTARGNKAQNSPRNERKGAGVSTKIEPILPPAASPGAAHEKQLYTDTGHDDVYADAEAPAHTQPRKHRGTILIALRIQIEPTAEVR